MIYVERGAAESLAEHLLRNADALGLDRDQVARLRVAYRLMLGTNAEKTEGGRIAVEVRDQLQGDLADVVKAAEARGEKVSVFNADGARRIKGRDGLAMLREKDSVSDAQFKAGMAYRYCYEVASAGLRSGLATAGEGRGGKGGDGADLHRAYVMARLAQMERAVAAAAQDGRETIVLRLVAGEGRPVRSIAAGGHARTLDVEALRRALTAASKVLPAGGLRITGQ